jgi:hypothetical protein
MSSRVEKDRCVTSAAGQSNRSDHQQSLADAVDELLVDLSSEGPSVERESVSNQTCSCSKVSRVENAQSLFNLDQFRDRSKE